MSTLNWQIMGLIFFGSIICLGFIGIIVDSMLYQKRKHRIARLRGHNPYSVGRDCFREHIK
jgi:hypothetical protein